MQMIGMQDKYQRLSRHKAGRSSRLAEDGVRTGSGATAPGQSSGKRGGEQKKTPISGGKVQLKEKQNRRKGGCLCANKGKPRLNNTMAA